jgi:hypothetical protein
MTKNIVIEMTDNEMSVDKMGRDKKIVIEIESKIRDS